MECLLPSEIARLVFGYLEEQKCDEAAQYFLEHSQYLTECLGVAKAGKKFSSRVHGNSLADVLEEYCAVQSLVAERIRKLPENSTEQLRNRVGLVEKLKVLLDSTKSGQTVAVSISVLPHGGTAQSSGTQATTQSRSRVILNAHERKRSIRFQGHENKQRVKEKEDRNVCLETSVETTPLDALPGLVGQGSRCTQTAVVHNHSRTDELEQRETNICITNTRESVTASVNNEELLYSCSLGEQLCSDKARSHSFSSTSTVPDKDSVQDSSVHTCEVGTSTNLSPKRKIKKKCPSMKISPLRLRKTLRNDDDDDDEDDDGESVSATVQRSVHRALLNNTAMQEKIAENINSLIRIPNDLGGSELSCGQMGSEDSEVVIQELNNAIKMVVDKTQEDPVFERLLEEIIGPTDEDMSSSPAGIESETDDAGDAPEATSCEDVLAVSIDADTTYDADIQATVLPEQVQNTHVEIDNNKSIDSDKPATSKRSSMTDVVKSSESNADSPKHSEEATNDTVSSDQNYQSNLGALDNLAKPSKKHGEKVPKKHHMNQGKERQESAISSAQAHQDTECSSGLTISKKEIQALLGSAEIIAAAVRTPKNDIPLKQRLRSARRSDYSLQGSTKETSSDCSLEDQNNKAIQFILEANRNAVQLTERENFPPLSDEKSVTETSHKTMPSLLKKSSNILEKSCENNNNDNADDSTKEQSCSSSQVKENNIHENEIDSHDVVSTSQEVSKTLSTDVFTSGQGSNSDVGHMETTEQASGKGQHVVMLTIPDVDNSGTSVSSNVPLVSQGQKTVETSIISHPLEECSSQEIVYMEKQSTFSQQHHQEMLTSQLPVTTQTQNFGNFCASSSKQQIIIDEGSTSAVIVCDSSMSFSPAFHQYVKGSDLKGSQVKKLRPIIPRPIRPKPSSFPLQLFTTDITPQYIVTQVPPGPVFEGSSMATSNSPGLMNIVNLTLPVISQSMESTKKICVCTTKDCGKKCIESSKMNVDSTSSALGTNSENSVDTEELSVISEHVPDNMKNLNTNENIVTIDTVHQNASEVCEDAGSQVLPDDRSIASNTNQKVILDMSALLLLPEHEQMPKPRDTPQAFIGGKACANARRLSLSTPRRRTSHIRALDFGTPQKSGTESTALKKSQTSPKPVSKNNLEAAGTSSRDGISSSPYKSMNNQARNVRSSLFTSPDPPSDKKDENVVNKQNSNSQVIPIATRSPVTHLLGDWDKATGVGLIFNGVSPENIVIRKDNRPSRLTPKTLLFSPESESSPSSDQNQTPPTNQDICASGTSVTSSLSHEGTQSLPDKKTIENNPLSQKMSPPTMPIKQKLKSRAWDADLRSLLSQDFEDVYVHNDTTEKISEETSSDMLQNKAANKSCGKDESTRKQKKQKEGKKSSKKNEYASDDIDSKNSATVKQSENEQSLEPASLVSENSFMNTENIIPTTSANDKEGIDLESNKSKEVDIAKQRSNSTDESSPQKLKHISRKRRAETQILEDHLSKRQKVFEAEQAAGKTVEEVLETMFREGKDGNSEIHLDNMKQKEIPAESSELPSMNSKNIENLLRSPVQDTGIKSSEASMNSKDRYKLKSSDIRQSLESGADNDRNNCVDASQGNYVYKAADKKCDQEHSEGPLPPLKSRTVTPEVCNLTKKSSEIPSISNSQANSKKAGTNRVENTTLETPVKHDVKSLFRNFNPVTPGPTDNLFPMTPRVMSPSNQEDTPITKLLRSEPCINFSMIVTPSLPPTPNIVISPNSVTNDSPTSYISRPTDYSSCSSSYYNPSKSVDTPSKLEQELIKECTRMEQGNKEGFCKEGNDLHNERVLCHLEKLVSVDKPDQSGNMSRVSLVETPTPQIRGVSISEDENAESQVNCSTFMSTSGNDLEVLQLNETRSESCVTVSEEEKVLKPKITTAKGNKKEENFDSVTDPENHITTFVINKKNSDSESQETENSEISNKEEIRGISSKFVEKHLEELPAQIRKVSLNIEKECTKQDTKETSESRPTGKGGSHAVPCKNDISHKDIDVEVQIDSILVKQNVGTDALETTKIIKTKSLTIKSQSSIDGKTSKVTKENKSPSVLDTSSNQKDDLVCQEDCGRTVSDETVKNNEKENLDNTTNVDENVLKIVTGNDKDLDAPKVNLNMANENVSQVSSTNDFEGMEGKECRSVNASSENSISDDYQSKQNNKKADTGKKFHRNIDNISRSTKGETSMKVHTAVGAQKSKKTCPSKNSSERKQVKLSELASKTSSKTFQFSNAGKNETHKRTTRKYEKEPSTEAAKHDANNLNRSEDNLEKSKMNKNTSHFQVNKETEEKTITYEHKETLLKMSAQNSQKKNISKNKDLILPSKIIAGAPNKSQKLSKIGEKNDHPGNEPLVVPPEDSSKIKTRKNDVNEKESSHLEKNEGKGLKNSTKMKEQHSSLQFASRSNAKKSGMKVLENKKVEDKKNVNGRKNRNRTDIFESDEEQDNKIKKKEGQAKSTEIKGKKQSGHKVVDSDAGESKYEDKKKVQIGKNSAIHACENLNKEKATRTGEIIALSEESETGLGNEKNVDAQKIDGHLSSVENKDSISRNNSSEENMQENDITLVPNLQHSSSVVTLSVSLNKERLTSSVMNICNKNEKVDQTNNCSLNEGVSGERSSDIEQSSSESDSEESSSDSSSDSSDDSSDNSSHSQMSSGCELDKVSSGSVLLGDSSLTKVSKENALDHSSKSTENSPSGEQGTLRDQTGSENINEILKSVSPVTYIHKDDMCFASELDDKKRRTLARLKGTGVEEVEKLSTSLNYIGSKDDKANKHTGLQQYDQYSSSCSGRYPRGEVEKNWEESSVEEFPVLHLSDSESAGNPTPHATPMKSSFVATTITPLKRHNLGNELKNKILITSYQENIDAATCPTGKQEHCEQLSEENDMEATENFGKECASGSDSTERKKSQCQTSLGTTEKSDDEVQINQKVTSICHDQRQFEEKDNIEYCSNVMGSSFVDVTKLNENEVFITLRYVGNICPLPKPVDHAVFCYSLGGEDGDDITITGSSFQNLVEIPSRDVLGKQKRVKERAIDLQKEEEKKVCSLNDSVVIMKRSLDSGDRHDSNSDSTSNCDESITRSQRLSSKLRPLDLLYEEMVKGNDSSGLSDETNNLNCKRGRMHLTKDDKRKTSNFGRLHQKAQKKTCNDGQSDTESIRYKSPLEFVPEYNTQDVDPSVGLQVGDFKKCDESTSKKEASSFKKGNMDDLEEGEIIDSPEKDNCSLSAKNKKGGSNRHGTRAGSRRNDLSEDSSQSSSTHRSKARSSDVLKGEISDHHEKYEKHRSLTTSSHHDDVRSLPPKKRKAVSEDTLKEAEKRARHDNPCRLLKNLNIDSFLNKVHGEDTSK